MSVTFATCWLLLYAVKTVITFQAAASLRVTLPSLIKLCYLQGFLAANQGPDAIQNGPHPQHLHVQPASVRAVRSQG